MKNIFIYSLTLSLVFIFGCSDQMQNNLPVYSSPNQDAINEAQLAILEFAEMNKSYPLYNQDSRIMLKNKTSTPSLSNNHDYTFYSELAEQAINPEDYACEETEFREYIGEVTNDWSDSEKALFSQYNIDLWYYYYILINKESNETFGFNGEFSNQINRHFKNLKRFWDIPSSTMLLLGGHSAEFYGDEDEILRLYKAYRTYGFINPATRDGQLDTLAANLYTAFGADNFEDYSHPMLSLNAIAAEAIPPLEIPAKIVMGDGLMAAYKSLGYGDVAPQAILAHEYAHQVQYGNSFDFSKGGETQAEQTRYTELMADALAAYYLTHKRGGTMNWKRTKEFLEVFYTIGDCSFDNPGHHGTPNQRMRAAEFGYELAKSEQKNGHISDSEDVIEAFEDAAEDIIED
jgi:hypothetical protein